MPKEDGAGFTPATVKPTISLADVEKLDVRVGTIVAVDDVTKSAKLLRLTVDFGDHKRTILAGMKTERAHPQEIVGVQALFVVNLEPKPMAGEVFRRACCSTSGSPTASSRCWPCQREPFPMESGLADGRFAPLRCSSGRLLVEPEHVPCRITKPGRDLGRVGVDGLYDHAAVGHDRLERRGNAVDHHVEEKAGLRGRRAAEHPSAAHLAGGVVEGGLAVVTLPDVPAEDVPIESRGARDVDGGNLDVADLAVRESRGHQLTSLS
jgi:tRNA-binding protein